MEATRLIEPIDEPVTVPEPTSRRSGVKPSHLIIGAFVVAAVALRFWLALGPLGRTADSDQAVVGLMALRLLRHHEVYAFYWGQAYGGSLESWLVAPFIAAFGANRLGLHTASILLELASAWVTWRVALHLFDRRIATWVGLLALWWPLAVISFGTDERGFYPATVFLGLSAVLMALNIDEHPRVLRHWVGLGVAVGVGWWMSPNIVYYAIPSAIWLLLRGHWRRVRYIGVALVAFVLGSTVWILANVNNGFASRRVPNWGGTSTYWSRFGFFWQTGLPFALGLRRPWDAHWYWSPTVGRTLYAAVLVALVVVVVLSLRRVLRTRAIDLLLLAMSPFVFAAFLPTWRLSEGRYTFFVASMLPLVLGRVLERGWGRVLVAAVVVLSGVAFLRGADRLESPMSPSVRPITLALERAGYHTAVADYWIAYRMTFESDEKMIATPLPGQASVRFKPYVAMVSNSTPAYVFNLRGANSSSTKLVSALNAAGIPYRRMQANGYYAILPERRLVRDVH